MRAERQWLMVRATIAEKSEAVFRRGLEECETDVEQRVIVFQIVACKNSSVQFLGMQV